MAQRMVGTTESRIRASAMVAKSRNMPCRILVPCNAHDNGIPFRFRQGFEHTQEALRGGLCLGHCPPPLANIAEAILPDRNAEATFETPLCARGASAFQQEIRIL